MYVKMQENEWGNFVSLDHSMKDVTVYKFSLAVIMTTDDLPKIKLEIFRLAARTF